MGRAWIPFVPPVAVVDETLPGGSDSFVFPSLASPKSGGKSKKVNARINDQGVALKLPQ
jgi:hypothetical protein